MTTDDMELVRQYAAHQSESAFAALVSRHTNLVYSASLRRVRDPQLAEEVTQAVFIILAQKAGSFDEKTILPGWLYRTAGFVSGNALKQEYRRQRREQEAYMQSTLDQGGTDAAWQQMSPLLEEAMLRLGQTDRDAVVLRFFEGRSLSEVSAALGASEDAAKKRLNRAVRKLRGFFTKRGLVLPAAVLTAAISANSVQAAPAALAKTATAIALAKGTAGGMASWLAAATKGSATATGAGLLGLLGAILTPVLGFLGMWKYFRLEHHAARSDAERTFYKKYYRRLVGCMVGTILMASVLMAWGGSLIKASPSLFATLMTGLILGYALALTGFILWRYRVRNKFPRPGMPTETATKPKRLAWEYRGRFQLLGLPFIHIRFGCPQCSGPMQVQKPVKAWIAVTDGVAFGLLFAYGGVAVAPASIGACAIGLFSYGAMAAGVLAVGGFAFGIWAFGAFAFGWQASAACAIAWNIASGGQFAIAHQFALGPVAQAAQVNTEFVRHLVKSNPFFQACWKILPCFFWLMWIWAIPMMSSLFVHWRVLANRRQLEKPVKNPP